MPIFKIEITETLQRVVEVEAEDIIEAISQTEQRCNEVVYDLDSDDFITRDVQELEQ